MKKSYLVLALGLLFFLHACNTKDPIQKKWKVNDVKVPDTGALMKLAPMISGSSKLSELVPKSVLKNGAKGIVVELLKQATFEFKSGNTCTISIFGKDASGTYRLSDDKKKLTVTSGDLKIGNKLDIKELSSDKLTFDMHLQGQVITFMLQPE